MMYKHTFTALICFALLMPYVFLAFKRIELSFRLLLISGLQLILVSALLLNYLICQEIFLAHLCRICSFIAGILISVNLIWIISVQLWLIFSERRAVNQAAVFGRPPNHRKTSAHVVD